MQMMQREKGSYLIFNFQGARQEAITIMLSMDCMEVPSLGSLLRKRSREGNKRM